MQKYSDIVLFNGQPLSGASVSVLNYPAGTLATIYIDNSVTVGPNPITTDINGRYSFYAANGRYSLTIAYPNAVSQQIIDFPLEDDPAQANNAVSVLTFGAVADGTSATPTDNTAAFNRAFASGRSILIPAGTYAIQAVSVPNNIKIEGEGDNQTFIVPYPGTSASSLFTGGGSNVEICELNVNVSKATFPALYPFYFSGGSNVHLHDIIIPNGGVVGIYTLNCTDVTVEHCRVSNCTNRCIQHDGTSAARTTTRNCYVSNPGGADHGIQVSGGVDHNILDNYSTLTTIFGISVFQSNRVKVRGNTCYNTTREGINATDSSDVTISENILAWDTTTSQDFGMSLAGQALVCNFNMVRGNKIINCGKSGIGMASQSTALQGCVVQGNTIENSNRLNNGTTGGNGAGIILYGPLCSNNLICDNKIFDNIGNLQYGVFEQNVSGSPSANKFFDNDVVGNAQAVTNITANSYEALTTLNAVSYTPTIAAGTGTLTTAAATGSYVLNGKMVFVRLSGTITTNGTGASSVNFTLPFTVGPSVNCILSGREATVTGKSITATANTGSLTLSCIFYDNTYPGANGATIIVSGWYLRS